MEQSYAYLLKPPNTVAVLANRSEGKIQIIQIPISNSDFLIFHFFCLCGPAFQLNIHQCFYGKQLF